MCVARSSFVITLKLLYDCATSAIRLLVSNCLSKSPCETSFIASLSFVIGSKTFLFKSAVIKPAIIVLKINSQTIAGIFSGISRKCFKNAKSNAEIIIEQANASQIMPVRYVRILNSFSFLFFMISLPPYIQCLASSQFQNQSFP